MTVSNSILIVLGKLISLTSKLFNKGAGSTWPGHIALSINPKFIKDITKNNPELKIILIAGTNGKTTTSKMISAILEYSGKTHFQNFAGANLLNGIASSIIKNSNFSGKINKEFAIIEVDENTMPTAISQIKPYAIIILNLFRDQLDRYGELDSIAKKWKQALLSIPHAQYPTPLLILNADDPLIAYIGEDCHSERSRSVVETPLRSRKHSWGESNLPNNTGDIDPSTRRTSSVGMTLNIYYFGLPNSMMAKKQIAHEADSIYCPKCGNKLLYTKIAYSHLGEWKCEKCKLHRPKNIINNNINSPLPGLYNQYNTEASLTFGKLIGIEEEKIALAFKALTPAFGRQEIIKIKDKNVQIFLSKNPTSFNQSLETIIEIELGSRNYELREKKKPTILFVLNDRIPDGTDVSWIWDTAIEEHIDKIQNIFVSGDRVYDMALRASYATDNDQKKKLHIFENLNEAINESVASIKNGETLYILPTYSAMLEVRKILTGRKILYDK